MREIKRIFDTIDGVRIVRIDVYRDARGNLLAFDERTNLPFRLRRAFYIKGDNPETVRASHAASSDLLLMPVVGSVTVDVDNGRRSQSIALDGSGRAVWTRPGVHIRLRDFSPSTVLFVCASEHFEDTRYFSVPQPALIDARELV